MLYIQGIFEQVYTHGDKFRTCHNFRFEQFAMKLASCLEHFYNLRCKDMNAKY